ncbi:MAG: carboxypeptidase-like regulatory domain-containing protein, partial [bacterium]|nr:carboxypeptidase-like regulatory domain-containing protein [bacterium]
MKQCFKIIKIAFIIVLTLSLLSPLYARQKTSDLDFDPQVIEKIPRSLFNIISLDLKDVSLVTALNEISVKGDIKFNYAVDRIPSTKKVTIRMSDVAALEALVKILKDTDTGLIITNNGQIAIVPKSEANVDLMKKGNINDGEITGTVKDAESGEPLIGANIVIVGTYRGAATDRDGNFQIPNLNEGTYII